MLQAGTYVGRCYKRRLFFFTLIASIFISNIVCAQQQYDYNANCKQAYQLLIQLRLDAGQQLLEQEKKAHPENLIPYFLDNYVDFLLLFFNEDPAEYNKRKNNLDLRLQLMQQGPASSPWYLFTQSIIHFQWAAIKIKFGSNWDAGWNFRRSFLQSKQNQQQFATFSPNDMLYGVMQVAAGTVPDGYKWLSNLLGIKGSIHTGMGELESFIAKTDEWAALLRQEAIFYYLYLKFYIENKRDVVFTFLKTQHIDTKNNHLFAYLAANLAINNQQCEYAKNIIQRRNHAEGYLDTPIWDLEMGYVLLYHLDSNANVYLERFLKRFRGKFYVKDVYQKLSWYYYLHNDMEKASQLRTQLLVKGSTDTEADKQAQKEAKAGGWPNPLLLKARLLNDGGYHREALQLLSGKTDADFTKPEEKTEFVYRMGRLYDDLGQDDEALDMYRTTITLGANRKEYFAARAALQSGYIYEKRHDLQKAIGYFQQCLDMKDHDYKNSLDQRAKAGIARCKGD